jgi:hypothetical protein
MTSVFAVREISVSVVREQKCQMTPAVKAFRKEEKEA